jgi:hypothetical protein
MLLSSSSFQLGLCALLLSATASATRNAGTETLDWTACPSPAPSNFQCANLTAPLYYDRPGTQTLKLNVVKIPAKNPAKRQGSWVYQEGGPGYTTASNILQYDNQIGFQKTQEQYDVLALDPRGVGVN